MVEKIGIAPLEMDASEAIRLVRQAEAEGFESVWTSGSHGYLRIAAFAQHTERITLGTAATRTIFGQRMEPNRSRVIKVFHMFRSVKYFNPEDILPRDNWSPFLRRFPAVFIASPKAIGGKLDFHDSLFRITSHLHP